MKRPIILVRRLINVSRCCAYISFLLPPLSILSPPLHRPITFRFPTIEQPLKNYPLSRASFFFFFFRRGKDARSISDSPLMDGPRSSFNKSTSIAGNRRSVRGQIAEDTGKREILSRRHRSLVLSFSSSIDRSRRPSMDIFPFVAK